MSYIETFEQELVAKLNGNEDTVSIVRWVSEKVLESYRNGITAGQKGAQVIRKGQSRRRGSFGKETSEANRLCNIASASRGFFFRFISRSKARASSKVASSTAVTISRLPPNRFVECVWPCRCSLSRRSKLVVEPM
jgi:hypothetical protein